MSLAAKGFPSALLQAYAWGEAQYGLPLEFVSHAVLLKPNGVCRGRPATARGDLDLAGLPRVVLCLDTPGGQRRDLGMGYGT